MSQKWDLRYLRLAFEVANWSKDPSTQCGAVIVRPNNTIASVGFNGFPAAIEDKKELYSNRTEKLKFIEHSEMNAMAHAYCNLEGFTMYCAPLAPCAACAKTAVTFGIKRFVYPIASEDILKRWSESLHVSFEIFHAAGVAYDEYCGRSMQHNLLTWR